MALNERDWTDGSQPVCRPQTVDRPPHWRARETCGRIFSVILYATIPAAVAGVAMFGVAALAVLALAVASTLLTEWAFVVLASRPALARHGGRKHTVLMGVLLGLSLPATAPWPVVVLAGVTAVVVGKGLMGGLGHYLWHPVLVGRLVAQALFPAQFVRWAGPVLARGHVFSGRLTEAIAPDAYNSWLDMPLGRAEAWLLPSAVTSLSELVSGREAWLREAIEHVTTGPGLGSPAGAVLFSLIWSRLPALPDMLIGATPGSIGATSAIALLAGGLFLMYHGYLRWQLAVSFLLAAAITAAVAPLRIGGPPGAPAWHWLPGLQFHQSMPVGPAYVLYHLLCGDLLLAVFFFAGDMVARPITVRGQVLFGLGCGASAILMRLYLLPFGAALAAVLLMNTFVPFIDRITQPRAFGH